LSGRWGLGFLDRDDVPSLVAVGQRIEGLLRSRFTVERFGEIGRHSDLSRLGVEFDIYVHLVSGRNTRACTVLRADRQHELAAY